MEYNYFIYVCKNIIEYVCMSVYRCVFVCVHMFSLCCMINILAFLNLAHLTTKLSN